MNKTKEDILVDPAMNLAFALQRETFSIEIRRNKIEKSLNAKRFQNNHSDVLEEAISLQAENKELPLLEVSRFYHFFLSFFFYFRKILKFFLIFSSKTSWIFLHHLKILF